MSEPISITAGDTVAWTTPLEAYPAPVWTLKYAFRNSAAGFDVVSSAAGAEHSVSLSANTTKTYKPGVYHYQAYVVNEAGDRHTVGTGALTVKADLASAASFDGRTHARRTLDAIEATLEGRATADQLKFEIAGRKLERTPIGELLRFRDLYRAEVLREEAAERIAKGLGNRNPILVRFR